MCTVSGARALDGTRNIPIFTDPDICQHIFLISMFARLVIEIRTQKIAVVVGKNGIGTDYILSVLTFPFKMPVYVLIFQWFKRPVGTFCTLVLFLVTQLSVPFVPAHRLVARLPACPAAPSPCKHILTSLEQIAEDIHFLRQRQMPLCGVLFHGNIPAVQQCL